MSVPQKVVVPQVDLEQNSNPHRKVVVKGVKQITTNILSADSHSDSNANWSFQPPSQNAIVDRRFMLRAEVQLTKSDAVAGNLWGDNVVASPKSITKFQVRADGATTATGIVDITDGATGIVDGLFALRQLPLHSIIEVIDLEINGTHISVSPSDYIHAVLKYTTPEYRKKFFGLSAHHPDPNKTYLGTYGLENHPLSYNGVGRNGELTRGKVRPEGALNTKTITYSICEPLMISPLLVGGEFEGLTNINQINVSIRWVNDLKRVGSGISKEEIIVGGKDYTRNDSDNFNASTGMNANTEPYKVSFPSAPELIINYYTPQDDIDIPNQILLPYNQPQLYIKSVPSVASGAKFSVVGDNIRINQVPQKVFIWSQQRRADRTLFTTDAPYGLDKISVSWNNQPNILSNASQQELHKISVSNGFDGELAELSCSQGLKGAGTHHAGNAGLVACLEFGKEIPLETNESVGTMGNYNLRIDADFFQTGATAELPEFFVMLVMNGSIVISPNEAQISLGNLNAMENASAESVNIDYNSVKNDGLLGGNMSGGGFLSSLAHFTKKGLNVAGGLADACDKYAPMVKQGVAVGKGVVGGNLMGGNESGGNLVGGMRSRRR